MGKRKPTAARVPEKKTAKPGPAARAHCAHTSRSRIEVFMYVRLNGLVCVCLEHDDLDRAKGVAENLCWQVEENLGLARLERLSRDGFDDGGEEIECAELVEVTQDHGPTASAPEFYALKSDGQFVEGDPAFLPPEYR